MNNRKPKSSSTKIGSKHNQNSDTASDELYKIISSARPDLISNGTVDMRRLSAALKRRYGLYWEDQLEEEVDTKEQQGLYPVLSIDPNRSITCYDGKPTHSLILGDNYHALKVLNFTHSSQIDAILIDPPYNTGKNDFVYNDRFVDKEDGYRHSKWLSFMAKRLDLSKNLLKPTGAIFIHIDENEMAQLKLLCDRIFGEQNFIESFIWIKNSSKNDSRTTSTLHEYVLCYARNRKTLESLSTTFRITKPGLAEVTLLYTKLRKEGASNADIEIQLNRFYSSRQDLKGISQYKHVDHQGIFRLDNASWPGGGGPTYTVLHPKTKKPVKQPKRGWAYSEETFHKHLADGLIWFGDTEGRVPCFKRYLDTVTTEVAKSVITDTSEGSKELHSIFGYKAFTNPKPVTLITTLLELVLPKDGIVLDYFAGSGSTAHAVMRMNSSDGGSRQVILVTNDEGASPDKARSWPNGGICTNVTLPRLQKIIEGYTNSAGKPVVGFKENLIFLETDMYEPKINERGEYIEKRYFLTKAIDLLRFKESTATTIKNYYVNNPNGIDKNAPWGVYQNIEGTRTTVVLLNESCIRECARYLKTLNGEVVLYPFTYEDDTTAREACAELKNVQVKAVPENLLRLYRRLTRHYVETKKR